MYYHNSFLLFACSLALARFRDFFFFHLFSFDAAGMVTSQLGHHYPFVRALECLAHSHIPTHEGYLILTIPYIPLSLYMLTSPAAKLHGNMAHIVLERNKSAGKSTVHWRDAWRLDVYSLLLRAGVDT